MARKLPWATGNQGGVGAAVKHESPDRIRKEPRVSNVQRQTPTKPRDVSGPPPVEPMIEGFDADDIWMMVEDEFDALAREFTMHLHQAEYDRRVKLAREAPPKPMPLPKSPMTKGTKRRLEQDLLHARQSKSLEDIGAGRMNGTSEEPMDDPWQGTSLARLIVSGSQDKVSLKGLDRLPSSTRAAQGYGRLEEEDKAITQEGAGTLQPKRARRVKTDTSRIESTLSYLDDNVQFKQGMASKQVELSGGQRRRDPQKNVDKAKDRVSPLATSAETHQSPVVKLESASSSPKISNQSKTRFQKTSSKRKKIKKESTMDDRVAEMPMFL